VPPTRVMRMALNEVSFDGFTTTLFPTAGRRHLPGEHQGREIPGQDSRDDATGSGRSTPGAPAGRATEWNTCRQLRFLQAEALTVRDRPNRPAIRDRLPRVQRVQARNLLGILLQELREP